MYPENVRRRKLLVAVGTTFVAVSALICGTILGLSKPVKAQTLTVGGSDQYPTKPILGWGVFPSYHHTSVWKDAGSTDLSVESRWRDGVKKTIYNELGVNFMRVELCWGYYDGAKSDLLSVGTSSTAKIQDLADHIQQARLKNSTIKYMVSIWSPPKELKENGQESGGHLIGYSDWSRGSNITDCTDAERKYIEFIVSSLNYLNSRVGLPASISLQNEPTHTTGYASCIYSYNQYVRVTKLMKQRFNDKGWSGITIIAAEANDYRVNWEVLGGWCGAVSGELNSSVGGLATHSYDTAYADSPTWFDDPQSYGNIGTYIRWDQAIEANPAKPVWMTEFCTESWGKLAGSSEIDRAINTARHLAREMVRFPTQYWFWWLGWSKDADMQSLTSGDVWDGAPTKTKNFYVLSKLWSNVPAGSSYVRKCQFVDNDNSDWRFRTWPWVGTGSSLWDWEVDAVGFRRADNRTVLLITNKNYSNVTMMVKGLQSTNGNGTMADVFTTTNDVNNQSSVLPLIKGDGTIKLLQRSVTIIVVR